MRVSVDTTGLSVLTTSGVKWNYSIPRNTDSKVHLLTIGMVVTSGSWYGKYGQYFLAWAPLPKVDKQILSWTSKNKDILGQVRSIENRSEGLVITLLDGSTLQPKL